MENMNVNAQVVNEVEVKEENVMSKENENKVRRFCVECGKEMWVESGSRVTICDDCREAKKKATAEKAHRMAQERKERLNLTTINLTLHEKVKEVFKANAKEKGLSLGDYLKELLGVEIEEKQEEKEIA